MGDGLPYYLGFYGCGTMRGEKMGRRMGLWIFQVIWVLSVVVLLEGEGLWVIQVIWVVRFVLP